MSDDRSTPPPGPSRPGRHVRRLGTPTAGADASAPMSRRVSVVVGPMAPNPRAAIPTAPPPRTFTAVDIPRAGGFGPDPGAGDDHGRRMAILVLGCVALALTIIVRLWYLQILDADRFEAASNQNQVRLTHSEAPRGLVLAADGTPLIENRMALSIGFDGYQVTKRSVRDRAIRNLSPLLGIPIADIKKRIEKPKTASFDAIPIADDVSQDVLIRIKEHQDDYPGVVPIVQTKRIFSAQRGCGGQAPPTTKPQTKAFAGPTTTLPPQRTCGTIAPHVLGYVGETTSDDLKTHADYRVGDSIGRAGVEASYESVLRGTPGSKQLVVNSTGAQIGPPLSEQRPVQGRNLQLTIDPAVQRATEDALAQGVNLARGMTDKASGQNFKAPGGAVVVMNPKDGAIVAMASFPDYDPSVFATSVDADTWKALNDPNGQFPLNNRAIQGQYAPASTFKVVTAMSGLQFGFIQPDTTIDAGPVFTAGKDKRQFKDWNFPNGHGPTDLRKSLVESVDVYYYTLGYDMYQRRSERWFLQETARATGLGARAGVDLPGERGGRVPDADWKADMHRRFPKEFPNPTWNPGESINLSIGQGDLLATPLQMATIYSAIANGGTMWQPHVAKGTVTDGGPLEPFEPRELRKLPLDPALVLRIRDDLQGVTTEGTANKAFSGYPMERAAVAGKTGTGQVFGKQDTSWFVGFAPANDPQFVVATVVEEAGHGGAVAAPVARLIFERIFGFGDKQIQQGAVSD